MKKIFVVSTTYTKSLEEVGKFRQEHFKFIQKNMKYQTSVNII